MSKTIKSDTAFKTISEVSEILNIPHHILRFWELKFIQLRPLKRGGGRRYYRPEDIILLKRIKELIYSEGLTIKGVKKLFQENGIKSVLYNSKNFLVGKNIKKPISDKNQFVDKVNLLSELKDIRDTLKQAI